MEECMFLKVVGNSRFALTEMDVTFLGTASAYPTPTRGVSCIVIRNGGTCWMFDCGEGSQTQLMKSHLRPGKISKIFISHLHGDHVFGLPGLMCTISQNYSPDMKHCMELFGPSGLRRFIRESLKLSRSALGFDYVVHELQPLPEQYPDDWQNWEVDHSDIEPLHPNERPGSTIQADAQACWNVCVSENMTVKAGWLKHRVPSFGYVLTEAPSSGKLDAQKLKSLGVSPGPQYAKIKAGHSIQTEDGRTIDPAAVIGPERPGRKLAVLVDSSDSGQVAALVQDADVIIHEATLGDDMKENALEKGHSTPSMAGEFAREARAKLLILTHFSQRFRPASAEIQEGEDSVLVLKQQGIAAFGSDNVIVAEDLLTVAVPLKPLAVADPEPLKPLAVADPEPLKPLAVADPEPLKPLAVADPEPLKPLAVADPEPVRPLADQAIP